MCIANSNDFDMDWALEVQKKTQAQTNSTFGNINGIDKFKVAKQTIKYMKRLQNLRIMDNVKQNNVVFSYTFEPSLDGDE